MGRNLHLGYKIMVGSFFHKCLIIAIAMWAHISSDVFCYNPAKPGKKIG